jgi:hypothetical protein
MGLFARFTCLRHGGTAMGFAPMVRDLLQARNVVETLDPAATERLLMIAPPGTAGSWSSIMSRGRGKLSLIMTVC